MSGEMFRIQARFEESRRRLLRATLALYATFGLGIALLLALREASPDAFEVATPLFVLGLAIAGVSLWRTARRVWRCPACDVAWEITDCLAASHWNHCASCGVTLRAGVGPRVEETAAELAFAREEIDPGERLRRFRRRRRLGLLGAIAVLIPGVAALVWVQSQEFGEAAEHAVLGAFGGVAAGILLFCARCPRCRRGLLAGEESHCQRCGLQLSQAAAAAEHRDETRGCRAADRGEV